MKQDYYILDSLSDLLRKSVLVNQSPITGLVSSDSRNKHAWVRDNTYVALSLWALSLAYKKSDHDDHKYLATEFEKSTIKLMRGLLRCMSGQKSKVTNFISSQNLGDALHAKYSVDTFLPVVGDWEYGHLQIDATSLYLLTLSQMIAGGLSLIFNADEVCFIQNLIFYIETAFRIPDYGIWERGDKTNHGKPELNCSSVGMAKAALEALHQLNLFPSSPCQGSVVLSIMDGACRCQAVLSSMLPRESISKEVDAGLLSIISYPAFAVSDLELINLTRNDIISKLEGQYGCSRFIRDGYNTAIEDHGRLHYQLSELKEFENIECEWPLFFIYFVIDSIFNDDFEKATHYFKKLEYLMVVGNDDIKVIPEMYMVPLEAISEEYRQPGSQIRYPVGKIPHIWSQALYIIASLLYHKILDPGEIDPLNRRILDTMKTDLVVQVSIIAESDVIKNELDSNGLQAYCVEDILPVEVFRARALCDFLNLIGQNDHLELLGRRSDDIGLMSTSQFYQIYSTIMIFLPQIADLDSFYLGSDPNYMIDAIKDEIGCLVYSWKGNGRPIYLIYVGKTYLTKQEKLHPALLDLVKKIKSGFIGGFRVVMGSPQDFINTSSVTNIDSICSNFNEYKLECVENIRKSSSISVGTENLFKKRSLDEICTLLRCSSIRCCISFDNPNKETPSSFLHHCSKVISPVQTFQHGTDDRPKSNIYLQRNSMTFLDSKFNANDDYSFALKNFYIFDYHEKIKASVEDLYNSLNNSKSLSDYAELINCLYMKTGSLAIELPDGKLLLTLFRDLYYKSCNSKWWCLVRYTSGVLSKRVDGLDRALTDLIIHHKQVTFGVPERIKRFGENLPNEEHIVEKPLPPDEIMSVLKKIYNNDYCILCLSQEIIIYLASFIRSDPKIFKRMIRIRVGLILKLMHSEVMRIYSHSDSIDGILQLTSLSPFELKRLLYDTIIGNEMHFLLDKNTNENVSSRRRKSTILPENINFNSSMETNRKGRWIRRREVDGCLDSVPENFYPNFWELLMHCSGGIIIANQRFNSILTSEMTAGEMKFALEVEKVLGSVQFPELRQLFIECVVLFHLGTSRSQPRLSFTWLNFDRIIKEANEIFLRDQIKFNGKSVSCCIEYVDKQKPTTLKCGGVGGICYNFYDNPPSGRYGTITYITRAAAAIVPLPKSGHTGDTIDCRLS